MICSFELDQVGMATNIPPHNLGEVVDALISLIQNPNATVVAQLTTIMACFCDAYS